MLTDFFVQFAYAGIFFFAVSGVGTALLSISGYRKKNQFLDLSLAFFISLCFFTLYITTVAFIFSEKKISLSLGAILYSLLSGLILVRTLLKNVGGLKENIYGDKKPIVMTFLVTSVVTFLFFLQIYQTSILDEWLHRPIVQSFVNTGIFPLVNPLDPTSNYIQTYHYGTQIVSITIQLLTGIDVSSALDVFKIGYILGTLSLFFGLMLFWTNGRERNLSLIATVLVLFTGSSFFLLDSFTANHITSLSGFGLQAGQRWSINAPLSYILSGITWVNVPLIIALAFFLDFLNEDIKSLGSDRKRSTLITHGLLGFVMIGFFLISEYFAAILVVLYFIISFTQSRFRLKEHMMTCVRMLYFGLIIIIGIYATGGIVGNLLHEKAKVVLHKISSSERIVEQVEVENTAKPENHNSAPTRHVLAIKSLGEWGYPSEKHILSLINMPTYYLRSLLLESFILGLFIYSVVRGRWSCLKKLPIVSMLMILSFVVPFILTSSFGDINLAKLVPVGIVLIHILAFYWLFTEKTLVKKWIYYTIFGLFIFGAAPGIVIGPNIQWQLVSNKGKEQYCSQNPLCYKGEFTDLLRKFEMDYPGLKHIQVDQKNAAKVVDLTNSYVYRENIPGLVGYVIETPEYRKTNNNKIEGVVLYESSDYRIWRVF